MEIFCKTNEERNRVLERLEKLGYVWECSKEKPTQFRRVFSSPMKFCIDEGKKTILQDKLKPFIDSIEWLKNNPIPKYNGRVVCVNEKQTHGLYTKGKIYHFNEGKMSNDKGDIFPDYDYIYTFEDLKKYSYAEWLEIVE